MNNSYLGKVGSYKGIFAMVCHYGYAHMEYRKSGNDLNGYVFGHSDNELIGSCDVRRTKGNREAMNTLIAGTRLV